MTTTRHIPVRVGDRAPDFSLPAVMATGPVAVADYRGKSALLVGFFRGLHCPFCRRQLFLVSGIEESLRRANVATVGVLNTERERAAVYFGFHPTRITLLADPDARTHQQFGIPSVVPDEEFMAVRVDPTGELSAPVHPMEANAMLNAKDGFVLNSVDEQVFAVHGTQLVGHFLIDRDGIVRWTNVECQDGLHALATFPSTTEILIAARRLSS